MDIGPAFRTPEPLKYLTRIGSLPTLSRPWSDLTITPSHVLGLARLRRPRVPKCTLPVPSVSSLRRVSPLLCIGIPNLTPLSLKLGRNGMTTISESLLNPVPTLDTKAVRTILRGLLTTTPNFRPRDRTIVFL